MLESRIKILFLATGSSHRGDRERLDEEAREIVRKIRLGSHRDRFEFASEWAVMTGDLQEALLRHNPRIVHFSGRGKSGGLILEDKRGGTREVPKKALSGLFRIQGNVGVVLLNACYTKDQAGALREVVDYTIGINNRISDASAIIFAAHFYQSLVFGRTVRDAFDLAVNQLQLEALDGAEAPELLVRHGVDQSTPFHDQHVALSRPDFINVEDLIVKQQQIKGPLKLRSTTVIAPAVLALAVFLAALGGYIGLKALFDGAATSNTNSSQLSANPFSRDTNSSSPSKPEEQSNPSVPPNPPIEKVFSLKSRVSTNLRIEQGDAITISATGRIRLGFIAGVAGPDGVPGFQAYSHTVEAPHGALLARIANSGDGGWRLIGSKASFEASNSGLLELLVNDKEPENNEGEFSVTVSISRSRKKGT